MKLNIKPLSVNQCWRGRRFKTPKYKDYEKEVYYQLPDMEIPEGDIEIVLVFGFSSKASDWDNPIKPFQDVLQKKYGFDDKRIYRATVEKVDVKKGEEFIMFNITKHVGR